MIHHRGHGEGDEKPGDRLRRAAGNAVDEKYQRQMGQGVPNPDVYSVCSVAFVVKAFF